jgi:hypothetical protein
MQSSKRQILAVTAAIAAIVMTAGTGVAELVARQSPAHPAPAAQWQPAAVPATVHAEDGEST